MKAICRHCNREMESGFIPDESPRFRTKGLIAWFAGKAERSWLGGIKLAGKKFACIDAYRCPECCRVELFAFNYPPQYQKPDSYSKAVY